VGQVLFLFFSINLHPLLSRSWNFSGSSVFFRSFVKFTESAISRFCDRCLGATVNQSSHGDIIVYSLFCIFIIISSSSSSSSCSISSVVLSSCLYLKLQVSRFVHFSSPSS